MIDWLNTRQRAVDDADAHAHHAVAVYHYSEVTLVAVPAMEGRVQW